MIAWWYFLQDAVQGDLKASEFDGVLAKYKLLWVESYPVISTDVKPAACLEEAMLQVVCPQERVIDAFGTSATISSNRLE